MTIICTVTNDLAQDQRMDRICRSLTGAGHDVTLVGNVKLETLPSYSILLPSPFQRHRKLLAMMAVVVEDICESHGSNYLKSLRTLRNSLSRHLMPKCP